MEYYQVKSSNNEDQFYTYTNLSKIKDDLPFFVIMSSVWYQYLNKSDKKTDIPDINF